MKLVKEICMPPTTPTKKNLECDEMKIKSVRNIFTSFFVSKH